jgi:hypothetical protein
MAPMGPLLEVTMNLEEALTLEEALNLITAYRFAFEKYCGHTSNCDFYVKRSLDACDCGLYAVMKGDLREFLD